MIRVLGMDEASETVIAMFNADGRGDYSHQWDRGLVGLMIMARLHTRLHAICRYAINVCGDLRYAQ